MKRILKNGVTSVILRFFLPDSASIVGAGKTGLGIASAGLIISTLASTEAAPTVYTAAGSTIETISTLGTFAAPTATKCRFKELDATNHPGVYEVQIADARFAVANARNLLITVLATGIAPVNAEIELVAYDPQDSVRLGQTALPNAAAEAAGGLYTRGSGAGQINQANNGQVDANAARLGGTTQTGRDVGASVLLSAGSGAGQLDFTSGVVKASLAQILGTAITGTAAQIAAAFTKFFDKATPTGTINSLPDVVPGASGGLPLGDASGRVTVGSVAADALTAAALATDAVAEIQNGLSTLTQANVRTATGLGSANLDTQLAALAAYVDTVEASLTSITSAISALNNLSSAGAQSAATAALAAYDGPTNAEMEARTLTPAQIAKLADHLTGVLKLVAAAGGSTTTILINVLTGIDGGVPSAVDDFYLGRVVVWITGALAGQATSISDYVGSTKTLTVVAMTGVPSAGDQAVIV